MKGLNPLLPVLLLLYHSMQSQESYLLAGTYTTGQSEGIYVFLFNSETGVSKPGGYVKTSNPSYLVVSPDEQFVYAVHEDAGNKGKGGEISAFRFDKKTGQLSYINQQPTRGDHPCYVEIDKTGRWVIAGNYSSGSLSVLPVQPNGGLGEPVTTVSHEGSGVNKQRQDRPHVHCNVLSADNRYLFVPDLGIDKVMIYSFDAASGALTAANPGFARSVDGSGPRHFVFHPNNQFAYLVEELSATVVAFGYENGSLTPIQRISILPPGDSVSASGADIHVSPDGKFLYASNRANANSIAIFAADPGSGKLTAIGHQSTLGKTPRNFNFDPSARFLLAANQETDNIVVFRRDPVTGLLADTGHRINVGKPVCLKWISKN